MWNNKCKLLLFDLDGTLLQSDKTISKRTLSVLKQCREKGILIGVSTSRSEQNSMTFLNELMPDILISSGGALVKNGIQYIYKAEFTEIETRNMINTARTVCGEDCEITIDTTDSHYWNYKIDPKKLDQSWGDSIYTDFTDFSECSLKMCVEIFDKDKADMLADRLAQCDCIRFSDGYWYKFTKKNVTKENAIIKITEVCGFGTESIIVFGDDYADIGMLELCGLGVAMGNAIDEVKEKADIVIGSNDEDGIAVFLEKELHSKMEKVVLMDELPENWTYPLIQPKLIEKYLHTEKQNIINSTLNHGIIREAKADDLDEILHLYLYLHEKRIPEESEQLRNTWESIINDKNHHLIVCEVDGKIVASCVCVIIPNLTRNVRPYAFVENVVTHADYRKKGYATDCLIYAKNIAKESGCYKMMLLTGSKEESTLNFYRNAGYNSTDKTAFIQWIDM